MYQDELRQANTKIAELTALANKLEAENSVVQGKTTRAVERLAAAEQQLEATRTQAEANLQSEMASHAQELDGVRSDYSTQLAAAAAKVSAQMREISELHTKVASAEALQTRVRYTSMPPVQSTYWPTLPIHPINPTDLSNHPPNFHLNQPYPYTASPILITALSIHHLNLPLHLPVHSSG